jgi:ATP-dependent exoDNAse (exonuclease V) beta subunit
MGVAGTMDLLMLCPDGAVIVDWKTNKSIYRKNGSTTQVETYKDLSGDTYSKYLMQLNTYAFLLQKEHGIRVKALKLVHLKDDGYEILDLPIMLNLVEEMANVRSSA